LKKEPHKIFDSHKNLDNYHTRITLTDLKSHQATNWRHKNIQNWWWLSLANHTWILQPTHKPKCLQDQPRSSNNELQLCIVEKERDSFPKKTDKISFSKTKKHDSTLEITTYIVCFKWN